MMFQPAAGVYGDVDEIDFTSMYPSIIVNFNLSPESLSPDARAGFLADVLRPVVMLRCETKQRKKSDPRYAGTDSLLKWMLVTCFGYTGYKNAKFGRIEVHEAITRKSREILIQTKEIAESRGFSVLHGIVDCLWVQGSGVEGLRQEINQRTGLSVEIEHFDWIVFLPLNDGSGAYNRYYGRLSDGSIKVRGIAARRHDAPEYIRAMQQEMLTHMAHARTPEELAQVRGAVYRVYCNAVQNLTCAPISSLAISRRISRTTYAHRCMEGAAVQAFRDAGIAIAPGMKIRYVVRDARRYGVDPEWTAERFDPAYYRELLDRAWREISYAFRWDGRDSCGAWTAQKELTAGEYSLLHEGDVPAPGSEG
jgi:DNA polymerase I